MNPVMNTNGRTTRKNLASQLDRLDSMLDGFSEALNEAVAMAVKEAVGLAVQTALAEIMSKPELAAKLRGQPIPVAQVAKFGVRERLRHLWQGVCNGVAGVCEYCYTAPERILDWGLGCCRQVWQGCKKVYRSRHILSRVKFQLLMAIGIGASVAVLALFGGPWIAAVLSGVGGFSSAVAVQVGLCLRRVMPALTSES